MITYTVAHLDLNSEHVGSLRADQVALTLHFHPQDPEQLVNLEHTVPLQFTRKL
jgi:hypothetical protein